ncbi:MAG TPA: fluoride efflux transporter CrcB [Chitinophagales bacterium]|nr:fluoride efflux transporter CrcB [Chitinophagales bacterium]
MNKIVLIIGLGGFIGTVARYLSQQLVYKYYPVTFPYGTLAVNLLGCFLIGIFYALSERGNVLTPEWRMFLTTGFCGGFTTFSAFTLESVQLITHRDYLYFLIYAVASVVLGITATFAGTWMIKAAG